MTGSSPVREPSYRRLAAHLRSEISSQRWGDDEALPTDVELARDFDVSRQTVRRAYLDLVNEGLIYRVPGRGTFIIPASDRYHRPFETVDDLLGLSHDTEIRLVAALQGDYDEAAAHRLRLKTRLLYSLRLLRLHQGKVFCHTRVFLPPEIGELLESTPQFTQEGAKGTATVIGAIAKQGVMITGAEQSITARAATDADAHNLGCQPHQPLLHIERLYVNEAGQPVELAISDFLPEQYTHVIRLGRRAV